MTTLDDAQWLEFEANGFLRLGRELSDAELAALQQRIDDIMLGKADVDYDRMLMQLDGNVDRDRMKQVMEGETEQDDYCTAYPQSNGHKGATLNYRKIQDLEYDPVYLEYLSRPLFRGICNHVYGTGRRIAIYRAMLMNKPAGAGSYLPWHHDRWAELDRDPLITVWTALDPATRESGCLQIIPGSHKRLINPDGFLTAEEADEHFGHGTDRVPAVLPLSPARHRDPLKADTHHLGARVRGIFPLKLPDHLPAHLVQMRWNLHLHRHVQIALSAPLQAARSLAPEAEGLSALGARRNGHLGRSLVGMNFHPSAEHRPAERDRKAQVEIVPLALEEFMRPHLGDDEQIPRRAAVG